jgi:aminoglycoside N3'-acetyltransferase
MITVRATVISALRKLFHTKDLRSFIRFRRLALQKLILKKEIPKSSLIQAFTKLGVSAGKTIWIQSSWNEFYNFRGKPTQVIDILLDLIGPEGTLVMPAIPLNLNLDRVIQIENEPVSTGLICEIFRRYPGVVRSIHRSSSVIALGPQAKFLTKDHHLTETPWDPDSPFQRLMDVDALCVGVGVGRFLASLTPLHAVESILRHEVPIFADIFRERTSYRWRTNDGREGEHNVLNRNGANFDAARFGRNYPKDQYIEFRLSNLWFWSISARDAINTGVALGRRGINMYQLPWYEKL